MPATSFFQTGFSLADAFTTLSADEKRFVQACDASISAHAAKVEGDLAEAIKRHRTSTDRTARSLALYTQAVLQGSFILAKAKGDAAIAGESIDHLRRYIKLLLSNKRGKD
jgi:TetR/AcrR family transcriptional repressor of nem operon